MSNARVSLARLTQFAQSRLHATVGPFKNSNPRVSGRVLVPQGQSMITYEMIKLMHQLIHQRLDDFMEKTAQLPGNQIHDLVESVEITGSAIKRTESQAELVVGGGHGRTETRNKTNKQITKEAKRGRDIEKRS
jgi:hypothetical protein